MKEFSAQTGGRYTYIDDIINLQELALAFAEIFSECDDFIVSGCNISGTTISSGYVYLNNKLRYFPGASGISKWPQYIYEVNKSENVAYAESADKVGRKVYGCAIGSTIPTSLDPITNLTPSAITIQQGTNRGIKDAFFGKYAMVLNPSAGVQTVNGIVNFNKQINAKDGVQATNKMNVVSGNSTYKVSFDGNDLSVQTSLSTGGTYKFVYTSEDGVSFYVNDTKVITITDDKIECHNTLSLPSITAGSVSISGNNVFNGTDATDDGVLYINNVSYDGQTTNFRNTIIGDGKGNAVLQINGKKRSILALGQAIFYTHDENGILLKSDKPKDSDELIKKIGWIDENHETMAYIGYSIANRKKFYIRNLLSSIEIIGTGGVNIGSSIRENGILLENKYALKSEYKNSIELKANIEDVYTKSEADGQFAAKKGGLKQFIVSGTNTPASLRQDIGAIGLEDMTSYPKISNMLSDMAKTESDKAAIRKNIGAVSSDECQVKMKDTGWLKCTGNGAYDLYARQIGNIVCIQGIIITRHKGTVFTVPMSIDCPYKVAQWGYSKDNTHTWNGYIAENSHDFVASYCNGGCSDIVDISITYMV